MRHLIISPATPGWDAERVRHNINGPSLIRVPEWVPAPLGRYYLYFAHHQGQSIRLAYADAVTGPWTIHGPGCLQRSETPFTHHIASPDVHIDAEQRQLVMYLHGCPKLDPTAPWNQSAVRVVSTDGRHWQGDFTELGESYFRVFSWQGWHYAIAKAGLLYRSRDGSGPFELRPEPLLVGQGAGGAWWQGRGRHWAVLREHDRLRVWFSRFHDAPEHILEGMIDLSQPWTAWTVTDIRSVARPESAWEGAELPIEPSVSGASHHPVHQLRDPAVFRDIDGSLFLLYSAAGESGIGLMRI